MISSRIENVKSSPIMKYMKKAALIENEGVEVYRVNIGRKNPEI